MKTHDATDRPKNARKRSERPTLPPETALEILQTSLDYVRGSGLTVRIGNRGGLCVIGLAGVTWNADTHRLCVTADDDTQAIPESEATA